MSRRSAVISALRLRARHFRRRGGILMYHRIATESVDPWEICVSPAAFDEQMGVLAATRAAVDLGAFTADRGGVLTSGGSRLAVTFDDGYADNLTAHCRSSNATRSRRRSSSSATASAAPANSGGTHWNARSCAAARCPST